MSHVEKNKPSGCDNSSSQAGTDDLLWHEIRRIGSHPDNAAAVIGQLLEKLQELVWIEKDIFGIHMAMEEAIINAIRHGNCCHQEKTVEVEIKVFTDQFFARITDQGKGFDLSDVPDPTLDENLDNTSGRGVKLIQSFMDRADYNQAGNSVELTKRKSIEEESP